MSEAGVLPPLDAAIFADTGAEPADVYEWLDWLEAQVSFPVYRVQRWPDRNLEDVEGELRVSGKSGKKYVRTSVPLWTTKNGEFGGGLRRKCTKDFKIDPVQRKLREICGITGRRAGDQVLVRQWMGISKDEAQRMRDSREPWIHLWYPLIESLNINRQACLEWMQAQGHPLPPRSACVFCPYHSAKEWRRLQVDDPLGYERACAFEDRIRTAFRTHDETLDADDVWLQYIVNGRPLRDIDWTHEIATKESTGQIDLFELWGNECEGMCGV